jgi:hypothetical protein
MSDNEREDTNIVDPPENTGGGGKVELDAPEETAAAVDPPSNAGGN